MKTIKGPAIFLAQFAGDKAPFNNLESIAHWAAGLGYKGVQIPSWDGRLFDLKRAAESKAYCDEIAGTLSRHALQLTELSTHLQGQLVAVHPAYDIAFDGFAPDSVKGNPRARRAWAIRQLEYAAKASANLGLRAHAHFPARWLGLTLSLAAAPRRTDRDSLRRIGGSLEAYLECIRRRWG